MSDEAIDRLYRASLRERANQFRRGSWIMSIIRDFANSQSELKSWIPQNVIDAMNLRGIALTRNYRCLEQQELLVRRAL